MGKDKQTAKKRLDKYYRLAKEQGFRSRAAFKLIQLNKKYEFLNNARVCIDLCAAPGGWLQVASKHMPSSSIIVGVDLAPIRPVLNCVTVVEDITAQKCREALRKHLGTWKADVVLHDGAPNVGTAWLQDAYGQAELTLSSLRLAAEFLRPGGTFVTKVFRSKDYNALLWVFNQLFGSVEATKPQASRNQSAEIFVVCRHFTAAKYIDPKLLDPRHVFKDLDAPAKPTDIFHQGKQRRHRDGYADDAGPLLFRKLSVARFVEDENPIGLLGEYNQLSFDKDSEFYANHKATNSEVKHCCEDLKVLNKRDFKALLKWRLSLRGTDYCKEKIKILREAAKAARRVEGGEEESDSEVEVEEVDIRPLTEAEEESLVDEEIDTKVKELDKRARKAKKLEKKRRRKLIQRANLKMNVDASDILQATPGEQELFELDDESRVVGAEVADPEDPGNLEDETVFLGDGEDSSDEDADYSTVLEKHLDRMYDQYLENTKKPRTPKESKGKKPKKHAELPAEDEFEGISRLPQLPKGFKPRVDATLEEIVDGSDFEEEDDDSDEDSQDEDIKEEDEEDEEDDKSKLKIPNSKRAAMWFSQPIFDDLLDDSKVPEIAVKDAPANDRKAKRGRNDVDLSIVKKEEPEEEEGQEEDQEEVEKKDKKKKKKKMEREMEMVMPTTQELDDMEMEVVKADNYDAGDSSDYDSDDLKETLALGTYAVRNRRFSHMIDDAYNRYAWNEDEKEIPKWFLDDENKHNKPTLPVTKEIMQEIRERFKAVDARPTKKVVEAKARKKMKAVKRSEKVKQQAVAVAGNGELSTKEKMRQIEKLYKGQVNKMKPDSVYVVAKKASGRIRGSGKGKRVKVVDPRMKKDKRAIKKIEKKSKGKGGKGGKGKGKGRGGGGRKG